MTGNQVESQAEQSDTDPFISEAHYHAVQKYLAAPEEVRTWAGFDFASLLRCSEVSFDEGDVQLLEEQLGDH